MFNITNCKDFEALVKLTDGFNGADMRNVCTEAGEPLARAACLRTH